MVSLALTQAPNNDVPLPAPATDLLLQFKRAWLNHPLASQIPQLNRCGELLNQLHASMGEEKLRQTLPRPTLRPLLAAAVVIELANGVELNNYLSASDLNAHSTTLQILSLLYRPLVSEAVVASLREAQ